MILIAGLGNPGRKFQKTRHNLGFRAVENLKFKIENFSNWKLEKRFQAEISQGKIANQRIVLVKPQTFMNNSGKAVTKLTKNYKLKTKNLFVVHDDLDLPLGKIRISVGRSSASHKGVQSIIDELETKNFVRFRIGIRPQKSKKQRPVLCPTDFVLQKFNKEEEKIVKKIIKKTIEAIEIALKEGLEKAMSGYNK